MTPEGLRPIRCQACGKLICEADGTVVFRCPRCKRRNEARGPAAHKRTIADPLRITGGSSSRAS
jgi:phage FluMu protein Com